MSSNAYGRISGSNALAAQGANTGYGGVYGVGSTSHNTHHGVVSHGGHGVGHNQGGTHGVNQNETNFINNIPPEDYLDKQNVNGLLKEAVTLLLENRPANPILFMAEHFRNMQQSQPQYAQANTITTSNGQQINVLNSNILKAYRLITLNKYDAKSFSDNVFQAYTMIEKDHTHTQSQNSNLSLSNTGIKGNDLIKLTQMLCIDFPQDIQTGILKLFDKKEEENVDFDEFLSAIKTIMLFDNYIEEMEVLFKYLDTKKQGKISKNNLIDATSKLRKNIEKQHQGIATSDQANAQRCELRIPSEDDIDSAYSSMIAEEDGLLNYEEYQVMLFKITIQDGFD